MDHKSLSHNETYHSIPESSLFYINKKIMWLMQALNLTDKDWPLDCFSLIKKIKETQIFQFDYGFFDLPPKYDAISIYVNDHNVYLMQININKVNYPFTNSSDRRMNFTLAHELAHIVLGHLLIPRNLKTYADLYIEEQEANEFAGRLLMPVNVILSCNFFSLERVAAYLNVSNSALWTRINNLERFDLLHKKKVPTCSCCGNTHFSTFAEYCGICGQRLKGNLQGIRKIYYPEEIPMDRYKRVICCPHCHADGNFASGDCCNKCGTYIFNYCSNYLNGGSCSYASNGNHRYCEICGRTTYFLEKGFIKYLI